MKITALNVNQVIKDLEVNPCVHKQVKDMLKVLLNQDCVDAYYNAKLILDVMKAKMNQQLGEDNE